MHRIATVAWVVWLQTLRRKDAYVMLVLLGSMLMAIVSLDIFGLGRVVGYVKDVGLLLAWIFAWVLGVSISTRQLPAEETSGTIFALLAKPIRRIELLVGKWLGCWSVVAVATLLVYGLLTGMVLLKGGTFAAGALLQAVVLHLVATGIVIGLGLAFSCRLHADASAALTTVLTGASFLILPRVPAFLADVSGPRGVAMAMLYYAAPHFELLDMRRRLVHGYGALPGSVFFTVLAYGLLLIALSLVVAWLLYRNKRFLRGVPA